MKTFKQYLNEMIVTPKMHLGIGRDLMPQIASKDVPEFLKWLEGQGVQVLHKKTSVKNLIPTQAEINTDKVDALLDQPSELKKPIIISTDDYILDGTHRWAALKKKDPNQMVNVIIANLKIMDLLAAAKRFPLSFHKSIHTTK